MINMKGPLFYAKILLFGEYGIIKDSKGLAIPYNSYQGALLISEDKSEKAKISNQKLKDFYVYLESLQDPEIKLRLA
jgi:mevalonate kinase